MRTGNKKFGIFQKIGYTRKIKTLFIKQFSDMTAIVMTEEDTKKYLNKDNKEDSLGLNISKNKDIITTCNDLLLERLQCGDSSMRTTDILAAKAEAFRQNQLLTNKSTDNVTVIGSILTQIQAKS